VLDQLVEQRDALTLIGELFQPEHRVLIEATGVERLDKGLADITRDGVELLSPSRILVEAGADAVDRRRDLLTSVRKISCLASVMEQRRLPDRTHRRCRGSRSQ
jgi:hypothetical protein